MTADPGLGVGSPSVLPPRPSGTYHEDDGHQVGEVGGEPVSPGQLHLVSLQHGTMRVTVGTTWVGRHARARVCVCVRVCTYVRARACVRELGQQKY